MEVDSQAYHNDMLEKIKLETQSKIKCINQNVKDKTKFGKVCLSFKKAKMVKLRDVKVGEYNILGVMEKLTEFGKKYLVLLENGKVYMKFFANRKLEQILEQLKPFVTFEHSILFANEKYLGTLKISGTGKIKKSEHLVVFCQVVWSSEMQSLISQNVENKYIEIDRDVENQSDISFPDISSLPKEKIHVIKSVDQKESDGEEKILITLMDGKTYELCDNLKPDIADWKPGSQFIIEKKGTDKRTKKTYVKCRTAAEGDWAGLLKYSEIALYTKKRIFLYFVRVIDIAYKIHKRKKRKIVLTENGDVYRFFPCKFESNVRPGWMLKMYKNK